MERCKVVRFSWFIFHSIAFLSQRMSFKYFFLRVASQDTALPRFSQPGPCFRGIRKQDWLDSLWYVTIALFELVRFLLSQSFYQFYMYKHSTYILNHQQALYWRRSWHRLLYSILRLVISWAQMSCIAPTRRTAWPHVIPESRDWPWGWTYWQQDWQLLQ